MFTLHHTRGPNGRFESKSLSDRQLNEMALEISADLYAELLALDPVHGEAWYDDDGNIPAYGSIVDRNNLLRARIAELKE